MAIKRGRIRLYFEGEERDLAASAKRAERAIDGVDDATKRFNRSAGEQSVTVDRLNKRNFELVSTTRSINRETDTLARRLQDVNVRFTSMRNLISLVKWPGLIAGAGYAAEGLGTVAAGATALTSALAPLSGALAAYPALLGSVGQAAGVLALTQMSDLQEALGGNEEALKRLSPAARNFLQVVKELEPAAKQMRSAVQEDLFAGLAKGLRDADDNFGVIQRTMRRTAGVLGNLAERAGELLGSRGFGRDFERIGEGNARMLSRLGVAGLHLGSALRHVMVAAQPFLNWLSGSVAHLAKWVEGATEAGRESGRLTAFFDRTREVMERLGSIMQSLGAAFLKIGHAAAPLGRQILAAFDDAAQGLEDWTESVKGQNALRDYFADAKPGIFEMGRLIRDLAGAFLKLSTGEGVFALTHAIRTELLPVMSEVVETTTKAFGTSLVKALVEVGKLFGNLAGSSGPLTLFVDSITRVLRFVNFLLEKVPGLNGVVVTMMGIVGVSKAMKFTAAITGVSTLIDLFKDLRTAAASAAVAEQAAAAGGVFGRGKGGKGKLGGLLGIGATTAASVAPLGMLSGAEVAAAGGAGRGAIGGLMAAAPAAGPWLAVAAAVAATAAGLVLLYKHSETFREVVEPVRQAAISAFEGIKSELAPLGKAFSDLGNAFEGRGGLVGAVKSLYPKVRGPLEAIGNVFRAVFLGGVRAVFHRVAEIVRGFGQVFSGAMQVVRGVVEVITGVLTLRFGKAWQGVKNIFSGGAKAALGYVRAIISPITGAVKGIASTLREVFGGAWEKVKSTFEDGANAVIGFVQKIADVINLIPGVPDIELPTFGGGDGDGRRQGAKDAQRRARGGAVTRPMVMVGEEAPQHPEWVIATNPRYRRDNVRYWAQAGRDLGIPGFLSGGDIARVATGAASTVGSAVSGAVGRGAGYFVDRLPKPELPGWLGGLGAYAISKVAAYIRSGFKEGKMGDFVLGPGVAGGGYKKVVAVGRWLQRLGYQVGEHPAFGGIQGSHDPDGYHPLGRAIDVNADGKSPSEAYWLDRIFPKLKAMRPVELLWRVKDHFDHLHAAFRSGGKIVWSKLVGSRWDNDELATLAHIVGMPNPGLMAQIAQGESSGNAKAVGHDSGGTEGLGLWQITTGYNDDLIAKYGGRSAMFNPLLNARAAAAILARQGLGAWYAPPTGARGKVDASLAQKIRSAISGKPVGGDGAGTAARDLQFGLGRAFATSMPGLPASRLSPEAQGLPGSIQALLRQPGLTAADRLEIGGMALERAEGTEGLQDDAAAAEFMRPFLQRKKGRIRNQLREVNRQLRKGGENEKQRRRNLKRRNRLRQELGETTGELEGVEETIRESRPTTRDYADLDLARAELTTDRGDDVAALQRLETVAREELAAAERSGDPREIAEATRNLRSATDVLREAMPSAKDFANRDLALAELTAGQEDDRAALQRLYDIAKQELDVALTTADPRDDIEAAQTLKGIKEALDNTNELLQQREEFEKERLELDKKLVGLAESQGPSFMAAFAAWIDGSIGGPVRRRTALPTTPGVAAGYQ